MSTSSEYDFAGHDDRIRQHYSHAREKHPYFCDVIDVTQNEAENSYAKKRRIEEVKGFLAIRRHDIETEKMCNVLHWHTLLECEVMEVYDAFCNGDKAQAVEELYDAIAVCLRAIDVLEGRQPLGNPATISGNESEK